MPHTGSKMIECDQIVIGCNNTMKLTFYDTDGNALSITGDQVRLAINRELQQTPVILKDSAAGSDEVEILAAPDDNCALVKILPADTDGLEEGIYCRSVELTLNSLSPTQVIIPLIDTVELADNGFLGTL